MGFPLSSCAFYIFLAPGNSTSDPLELFFPPFESAFVLAIFFWGDVGFLLSLFPPRCSPGLIGTSCGLFLGALGTFFLRSPPVLANP